MMGAIDELTTASTLAPARIDAFVAGREFPIVEGRRVTFVWRGPATAVRLRHWIFGLASSQTLIRLGEEFWYLIVDLPERSRIEYKFEVEVDGDRRLLMDPLNPRIARDPFGANSVCHGAGYETPLWALPDSEARPGTIDALTVDSATFGRQAEVRLYMPARFRRNRRYPLLVVHDGDDFLRFAALGTVLDNLIHRLELAPMIVAFTQSPDRLREYAADERHPTFLADELLPRLEEKFPLVAGADARGLVGASLGAVAALHAAWVRPKCFGRLFLASGSFAFSDIGEQQRGPIFDPVATFVNRFREQPGRPVERLFLTCGVFESLIYENRSMVPVIQSTGIEVRYEEARDGHNWENWRDRLRDGLSWLFPGPLWMIYE